MNKKIKTTQTIEAIFEEASRLLKEGRSASEVVRMYPAHRQELSDLLSLVAFLREEGAQVLPREAFVRRLLSKLDPPITVSWLRSRFALIFSLSTVAVVIVAIMIIPKFLTQSGPQDLAIRTPQSGGDQIVSQDLGNIKSQDILKTPKTTIGQSAVKNGQAVSGIVTPTGVAQAPAATTAFDETGLQNSAAENVNFSKNVNDYFLSESQAGEFDAFLNQF